MDKRASGRAGVVIVCSECIAAETSQMVLHTYGTYAVRRRDLGAWSVAKVRRIDLHTRFRIRMQHDVVQCEEGSASNATASSSRCSTSRVSSRRFVTLAPIHVHRHEMGVALACRIRKSVQTQTPPAVQEAFVQQRCAGSARAPALRVRTGTPAGRGGTSTACIAATEEPRHTTRVLPRSGTNGRQVERTTCQSE